MSKYEAPHFLQFVAKSQHTQLPWIVWSIQSAQHCPLVLVTQVVSTQLSPHVPPDLVIKFSLQNPAWVQYWQRGVVRQVRGSTAGNLPKSPTAFGPSEVDVNSSRVIKDVAEMAGILHHKTAAEHSNTRTPTEHKRWTKPTLFIFTSRGASVLVSPGAGLCLPVTCRFSYARWQ